MLFLFDTLKKLGQCIIDGYLPGFACFGFIKIDKPIPYLIPP